MAIKLRRSDRAPLLALVCYILLILSGFISGAELGSKDNIYLSVIVIQLLIFVIPGIIYCKLNGYDSASSVRFGAIGSLKVLFTVFAVATLICTSALLKLGLYELGYSSAKYSLYKDFIPAGVYGVRDVVYVILALAVLPAVTEEFVFRGIILSEYQKFGCRRSYAVLFSSLLFAMMHFSLWQFPVYLLGGATFAVVLLVTGSLTAAMLAHILNNSFSILFESTLIRFLNQSDSSIFVMFIFGAGALIFLIITLHFAEKIYLVRARSGDDTQRPKFKKRKKKERSPEWFCAVTPPFIVCIIIFILKSFGVF